MRILLESVCTLWTTVSGGRFGWVFVWQLTIDNVWPGHGTRSTPAVAPLHQAPEHCAVPGHQHQIRLNHMSSNRHRLGHHRHIWCCTSGHTRILCQDTRSSRTKGFSMVTTCHWLEVTTTSLVPHQNTTIKTPDHQWWHLVLAPVHKCRTKTLYLHACAMTPE